MLNRVLGIIAGNLLQSHEVRPECFYAMPFERILVMLFADLYNPQLMLQSKSSASTASSAATSANGNPLDFLTLQQYLPIAYGHLLHILRPERATNFIFAWVEMVAHRRLVDKLLATSNGSPLLRAAYRATYAQLLVDLMRFLTFYLQNALLPKPIVALYSATFRLCLVLFHDFPDFVSEYCMLFCEMVPSNSLQLRNLILSAEPKRTGASVDPLNVSLSGSSNRMTPAERSGFDSRPSCHVLPFGTSSPQSLD